HQTHRLHDFVNAGREGAFVCPDGGPKYNQAVFLNCSVGEQLEILKNNSQLPPEKWYFFLFQRTQIDAPDPGVPVGKLQIGVQDFEQAGFSTACFADEVYELPLVDMEVDIGQYQVLVVLENIRVLYLDDILFHAQISSLMIFP